MDLRPFSPRAISLQAAWRTGLCLTLIGAVVFALHLISALTQVPETFVDIRQNNLANDAKDATGRGKQLRFAVTAMVGAEETFSTYRQMIERISRDIGREEWFIMRPSYEQVRLKLEWGEVDVALVCTGTYLRGLQNGTIKLLVQPELEKGTTYRSLLIVPSESRIRTWEDLRDAVVAFTDHESFTGYVLPSAVLMDLGHVPDTFFRKIVYTSSHDRSILATFTNAVDAAAVDSLVWISKSRQIPSLDKRVKIIWQSPSYGPPPVVVPKNLDRNLEQALRKSLLGLHEDEEGRRILSAIGIKRFVPPRPETYADAVRLYRHYQGQRGSL